MRTCRTLPLDAADGSHRRLVSAWPGGSGRSETRTAPVVSVKSESESRLRCTMYLSASGKDRSRIPRPLFRAMRLAPPRPSLLFWRGNGTRKPRHWEIHPHPGARGGRELRAPDGPCGREPGHGKRSGGRHSREVGCTDDVWSWFLVVAAHRARSPEHKGFEDPRRSQGGVAACCERSRGVFRPGEVAGIVRYVPESLRRVDARTSSAPRGLAVSTRLHRD